MSHCVAGMDIKKKINIPITESYNSFFFCPLLFILFFSFTLSQSPQYITSKLMFLPSNVTVQ